MAKKAEQKPPAMGRREIVIEPRGEFTLRQLVHGNQAHALVLTERLRMLHAAIDAAAERERKTRQMLEVADALLDELETKTGLSC